MLPLRPSFPKMVVLAVTLMFDRRIESARKLYDPERFNWSSSFIFSYLSLGSGSSAMGSMFFSILASRVLAKENEREAFRPPLGGE